MINKSETTALLEKLVSINSPYFKEEDIINYVKDWFDQRENP